MKKILILSDTHGNIRTLEKLTGIMKDADLIFHLGDYQKDIQLYKEFSNKIYSVKGNCDGGGKDLELDVEGVKILLTHGDKYSVKSTLTKLFFKAKEQGFSLVCFGHTHQALIEENDGIMFINPGSLSEYGYKSYCYCVIHQGKIVPKIVNLEG